MARIVSFSPGAGPLNRNKLILLITEEFNMLEADINAVRDSMRAKIFNPPKETPVLCEFFGTQVELKCPTMADVFAATSTEDKKTQAVNMIIQYCYIPNTDVKVFEDADKDSLLQLPFNKDMTRLQNAMAKLINPSVEEELGNSEETSTGTTS